MDILHLLGYGAVYHELQNERRYGVALFALRHHGLFHVRRTKKSAFDEVSQIFGSQTQSARPTNAVISAGSARPVYRSAAHRKAVMAHVVARLAPIALCFAVLAPLVGLALIWGNTLVAMICNAISTDGASIPAALETSIAAITSAYAAAAIAAAISGVWVAMLSPFTPDNPCFWSGAAIVGMMNAFFFVNVDSEAGIFGGQLFIALVGAVSIFPSPGSCRTPS